MSRERSPNHPTINLEAALRDAKTLHDREGRSSFQAEVVAKALGYAALNGASRRRLGALRQYGLIERQKGKQNGLTNRALTLLIRPSDSTEWKTEIKNVALKPKIFRSLQHKIEASEESIAQDLMLDHSFTKAGATLCAKVFKATVAFAELKPGEPLQDKFDSENMSNTAEGLTSSENEYQTAQKTGLITQPADSSLSSAAAPRLQTLQLPLSPSEWARLQAYFPMTDQAWTQMMALLNAMKPGLTLSAEGKEAAPIGSDGEHGD